MTATVRSLALGLIVTGSMMVAACIRTFVVLPSGHLDQQIVFQFSCVPDRSRSFSSLLRQCNR